jgi:signal peptidase I
MNTSAQSREWLKRELAAETLRQFSEVRFVAHGSSMLPSIYPGDYLTAKSFGSAVPHCGDIVLCRRSGEFRVHRIVNILEDGPGTSYTLRGDALLENDPPVTRVEILGRVTSLLRRGKPVDLGSVEGLCHRVLRWIVRRSGVAGALLLGWHALLAREIQRIDSLTGKSAEAKMECT